MAKFEEDEQHLRITIRHYGIRFLSLVLFITSIVCFNNPKKPDGPILGIGFFVAVVIILVVSRSVSIDLNRATGWFTMLYGGILFGIPKKRIERPLAALTCAETHRTSDTGLARTNMKGGSRVVFLFGTEKIPLTKFLSSGDMDVHHEIEQRVNGFLERYRSRSRM